MRKFIFISLLLFSGVSLAQIKIGDKSPAINITDWIQNRPAHTSLANKFVVIDFWATWCAPCLASMAHMNELTEEMSTKDNLIFLTMSDEKKEKISPLLTRVAFKTYVVTDTTRQTQNGFGISSIPDCIIIDDKAVIRWRGNPAELTNNIIESILTGKSFTIADNYKIKASPLEKEYDSLRREYRRVYNNDSVREYFSLAPFFKEGNSSKAASSSITGLRKMEIGIRLKDIVSEHISISSSQISLPSELQDVYASFCYKSETRLKNEDVLNSIFFAANLTYKKVDSTQKFYLLEVADTTLLSQSLSKNENAIGHLSVSDDGSYISMSNWSLYGIIPALQDRFGCPVIMNDIAVYNKRMDMMLQTEDFITLKNSLKIYGITIKEVKQTLPFVMVMHK